MGSTPKVGRQPIILVIFAEDCIKMKNIGPRWGDPPMPYTKNCTDKVTIDVNNCFKCLLETLVRSIVNLRSRFRFWSLQMKHYRHFVESLTVEFSLNCVT